MTLVDTRTPNPDYFIAGATGDWEMVVGLEIHAQVTSESKLFSASSTQFGEPPNANVSFVDAAMPGMLPVINEECVRQAIRTGLGLKAKINNRSLFDRKNYFYPDLPQGYQISQFKDPIVGEGEVHLDMGDKIGDVTIGIERLHLEQDAGKSIHDQHPSMSFVDLNRSGVALMEIVSKPDIRSSAEARAYITKIRTILRYLGTCDGNMEQGSLRADLNISVRKPGGEFGTRCEIKNVNSVRFAGQAIEYEARRQIDLLEDGGKVEQQTRLFDPKTGETRSMRSKEEAHDYRYFPDPDLLPLVFEQSLVDELAADLPELPDEKQARLVSAYGVSSYNAKVLTADPANSDYFESVIKEIKQMGFDGKEMQSMGHTVAHGISNMIINELFGKLKDSDLPIEESRISAAQLASIAALMRKGDISSKIAKDLFEIVWSEGGDPAEIVENRGMKQVSDTGAIEKIVDEIIAANPDQVAKVKDKPSLVGWFVGQVMKASHGKANPQAVNEILRSKLGL